MKAIDCNACKVIAVYEGLVTDQNKLIKKQVKEIADLKAQLSELLSITQLKIDFNLN